MESGFQRLDFRLARAMTSNGTLMAFGARWLMVGVVLGTIAPEVKCVVVLMTNALVAP